MTKPLQPAEWNELMASLRQLTGLIAPLQAILAQEEQPGVSDRIQEYIRQVTRIADLMESAVDTLQERQDIDQTITTLLRVQKEQLSEMRSIWDQTTRILQLFGAPMKLPADQ